MGFLEAIAAYIIPTAYADSQEEPEEETEKSSEGSEGSESKGADTSEEGGEGSTGGEEESGGDDAAEGGEEEEEEEEEEEPEPEDIFPKLLDDCSRSKQCRHWTHHYEECVERVQEKKEHPDSKLPKEDCVEEFFHQLHCATQCAAPKLFARLK